MLSDFVLLVTGCIKPDPNVPFLEIKDYESRKEQYLESIKYYIEKTKIQRIVFCDNSLAQVAEELNVLARKHSKSFEWLSFSGNHAKAVSQGKGYGEGEIIEYALNHSTLLHDSEYFIKVTGRVIIKNVNFLLRFMHKKNMYFCRNSQTNIDTKFYGIPIQTYKNHFQDLYKKVDDNKGKYLENLFSDEIQQEQLKVYNFAVYPDAKGISGSTGKPYSIPLKRRIKLTIKSFLKM